MHRRARFFMVSVIPALLAACDAGTAIPTSPSPSAPSQARLPVPSGAPAIPGNSGVFRFTDGSGFFVYDFERGLLSLHGSATLFTDICAGGTPPDFEPVNIQTIATASGLHVMFRDGAHPVQIYPAVPFGCPSLAVTPRIAAGTARIIRVDNDVFGDPRAMNAFGWQASGLLADLVNGGAIRYDELVRVLFDPRTGEIDEVQLRVQLH